MGARTLYRHNFEKHYRTSICSCVAAFYCATLVLAIIAPFAIVYSTGRLWTKQSSYLEQAQVQFTKKLLAAVVFEDGSTRTFSTVKEVNDQSPANLPGTLISLLHADSDFDGVPESLKLVLTFKGDPSKVRNVQILGSFDYQLSRLLELEMISLFHLDLNTPNGAAKIVADGELQLVQQEPIMITSKKKDLYDQDPLDSIHRYSLPEILEYYEARNEKTFYNYQSVIQPFGSAV